MNYLLKHPIQVILSCFGYVRVPLEAIIISMDVEESCRRLYKKFPEHKDVKQFYKEAKAITDFLRSGRFCYKE